MEQKPFGLLLEDVIGNSHEDILVDDQMATYHQKLLVAKGSLLTVLSHKEAKIIASDIKALHNYKFILGGLTITLHCSASQVFPITENQRALLQGVPRKSDRIEVLHNLDWVEKLHFGSFVYVTIPTIATPVRGIVSHVGPLEGEVGTKFGIELQERRGEGTSDGTFNGIDYFECDPDCAVFVSMDKLTQKESFEAAKVAHAKRESPQPEDDKPFKVDDRVKVFNKNGIEFKGTVRSIKKNILGIETEKSLVRADFPEYVEDSKKKTDFTISRPHHSKLFLPAYLVKRDQHETSSKESSAVNKNAADGNISSQKKKNSGKPDAGGSSHMGIDNEALEEIKKAGINPGTFAHQKMALKQFEAEQKQQLAKPKKNKEIIEQKKRIQEAKNELKMEDWSALDTSLLDIEKQKKLLEEATHDKKMQEEKMLKDKIIEVIRLQEEKKTIQEAGVLRQGEDDDRQKRLQEDNRLHEEIAQQQREEAARQKKLQEEKYQREEAARQKNLQEEKYHKEAARWKKPQEEKYQREEAARQKRLQEEQHQREEVARKKRLQEENRLHEEATQRKKEEAARQNRIQGEAAPQERWMVVQQNKKTCKTYPANKCDDNDSQSEEYFDASDILPNKQKGSPADAVCIPRNHGVITSGDSYNPDHFGNHSQHNAVAPVVTTQPQGYKPMWSPRDPQPSNDNPHKLEVGSLIQFGNPPCYGVIKWMGTLPETEHVLMAGVEVDIPIEGYTKYDDGWHGGKKLFKSKINRGLFLPMKGLHPDKRFASGDAQELPNPITKQGKLEEVTQSAPAKSDSTPLSQKQILCKFELGSMIQYGTPPQYGVIKWIGTPHNCNEEYAGLEMEEIVSNYTNGIWDGQQYFKPHPGRGKFVKLTELQLDERFVEKPPPDNPLKHWLMETKGFVQSPSELTGQHVGFPRGIQGQHNSCYLDSTLYGLFAFSDAFDGLFLHTSTMDGANKDKVDIAVQRQIQDIIQYKIVNPLRKFHIVPHEAVLVLRSCLSEVQKTKGLLKDEKDPEEFLNLLFKHIFSIPPYLKIRRPSGIEGEFFIQLFVDPDANSLPSTQSLLHKMFLEQRISFEEYPARLLLQIPRSGKDYKVFNRVKPSLQLNVDALCDIYPSCLVCGQHKSTVTCMDCKKESCFVREIAQFSFCSRCSELWHNHPTRQKHKLVIKTHTNITGTMQLLSVLCIQTSHYVCFNRVIGPTNDQWVFFDSMAKRPDDVNNLPEVTVCTELLKNWVYSGKDISKVHSKELPEVVRRFIEDAYLCIYYDPEGTMYQ